MIKKIILTIKTIKNLNILFLDFFGLLHGEITYKLWNGILMNARAGSTDFAEIIIINGDLEYPSRFFPQNENPVILDIGAHIGVFSVLIAKKLLCKKPTIYSVEPNSKNFQMLKQNIKLNHFYCIKPFMLGITEKNGKGFLFVEGKRYDGGYVDTKENKPKRDCEEIMTNSLNNFCKENNISTIDLLKMDIEGSEYKVFDSSTDFIKKNIKSIFVELHNIDKKNNYTEFKNNISKLDFVVEDEIMNRTLFLRNKKYLNEKI